MKSNVYKDEELELLQGSMIEEDCQTWSHFYLKYSSRPRWLSWMRRPTGDQEVAGSTPAEVGNILWFKHILLHNTSTTK